MIRSDNETGRKKHNDISQQPSSAELHSRAVEQRRSDSTSQNNLVILKQTGIQ